MRPTIQNMRKLLNRRTMTLFGVGLLLLDGALGLFIVSLRLRLDMIFNSHLYLTTTHTLGHDIRSEAQCCNRQHHHKKHLHSKLV